MIKKFTENIPNPTQPDVTTDNYTTYTINSNPAGTLAEKYLFT